MQDQTIQWLTVILGSLLFLDACRRVVTRHIVAGRVGGDTPRSCCRNDNRENGLVQAYTVLSLETCKWVVTRHVAASGVGAFPKSIRAIPQDIITCGGATLFGVSDTSIRSLATANRFLNGTAPAIRKNKFRGLIFFLF